MRNSLRSCWRSISHVAMGCDCENRKKSGELSLIEALAKKAAVLNQCIYAIYRRDDGTYAFTRIDDCKNDIVELIHYL